MVVVFGTALALEWSALGSRVPFGVSAKHWLMKGFTSSVLREAASFRNTLWSKLQERGP